jgi:hypothetical protein
MSKLKSAGLVFVVSSLIYFSSPAAYLRFGSVQPASAIEIQGWKTNAQSPKIVQKNSQQNSNTGMNTSWKTPKNINPSASGGGSGKVK